MRLFVACNFEPRTLDPLIARLDDLRPRMPPASWARPGGLHLTLAFLGEQNEEIVDPLSMALESRLERVRRFDAWLGSGGFFPVRRRARVAWLTAEPRDAWLELGRAVREAIHEQRLEIDDKELEPHLTVARMKSPWRAEATEQFISQIARLEVGRSSISEVHLYKSDLRSGGAIHTRIRSFTLQGR